MATASARSSFYRVGDCKVFLQPWLASTTTGAANFAAAQKAVYALFYADGDNRKAMKAGVNQWVDLAGAGVGIELKANPIVKTRPGGVKNTVAYGAFEGTIEVTFNDTDVDHMKDIFSSTVGQLTTISAGVGKAGRKSLAIGGQTIANRYVVLVQFPSLEPGEWENYLGYCATIDPVINFDAKGDNVCTAKVKFSLMPDDGVMASDTNKGSLVDLDEVTAKATS